jgi:hypothetical protein
MNRLLGFIFVVFPACACAMGGEGLVVPLLTSAALFLGLTVGGIWSLFSLAAMRRWGLVLVSLGGGLLGVLWFWLGVCPRSWRREGCFHPNEGYEGLVYSLSFIEWLLVAAVVLRLFATFRKRR